MTLKIAKFLQGVIDRGEKWTFAASTSEGIQRLARHSHTAIQQHIKVQGQRSVFDADWIYAELVSSIQ